MICRRHKMTLRKWIVVSRPFQVRGRRGVKKSEKMKVDGNLSHRVYPEEPASGREHFVENPYRKQVKEIAKKNRRPWSDRVNWGLSLARWH
jgi:hypothetical protein